MLSSHYHEGFGIAKEKGYSKRRSIRWVTEAGEGCDENLGFDNPAPFRYVPPMEQFLDSHGYVALFALSFLASTIIPVGSEWLLVAMVLNRSDPFAAVAVATIGNTLGAGTTWAIGIYGGPFLIRRVLRIDAAAEAAASSLLSTLRRLVPPAFLAAVHRRRPLFGRGHSQGRVGSLLTARLRR